MDRRGPPTEDLIDALARGLEVGLPPAECLATLARAGPATARLARQLEEHARGASLATALTTALALSPDEGAALAIGEAEGKLAAVLRWVIERRATRRARRRAVAVVTIAPLLIGVVTLLLEPLPAVILGTGSFAPVLRGLAIAALASGVATIALRRVPTRVLARVPVVRSVAARAADVEAAALIAALAEGDALGAAPRAVREVVDAERAGALEHATAEPRSALAGLSEPLALVVAVGQRTGDLPSRARAFAATHAARLTARARMLARVLAWAFALAATLHATRVMMQLRLPSLGGDLQGLDSPELRELMKELDSAGP